MGSFELLELSYFFFFFNKQVSMKLLFRKISQEKGRALLQNIY